MRHYSIPKTSEYKGIAMTQKQKDYIQYLEEFSGSEFDPRRQTISEYINANKNKAKLNSMDNWSLDNGYF